MPHTALDDASIPQSPRLDPLAGDGRFALLLGSIKDYAIYLLDADGKIRSWNAGAQRFKGYTEEEVLGRHFSIFYTPEDRNAGLPQRGLSLAARDGAFETEGWRVRKDGTRFWAHAVLDAIQDDSGNLVGFAKITRDLTNQKAVENALFTAEQQFRMLVDSVRDYAIYMLNPDGIITNWNTGAQAIKGYTAEEIIGKHFSCFYTPEDRAAGEPERALATAMAHDTFQNEAWRVRKDGSLFWASVVLDPIRDSAGNLVGFAKITRDITERKREQEELERNREAISQAQKLEAIGRLTGGVAHDFNNFLTIIRSSAEFLQRHDLSDEKRTRYVAAIADTADRAALLTGQLLAFARQQPLRPEAFDVADRIRGLRQIINASLGASVQFEAEFPANLRPIEADANHFDTAILNMVINARDAMPQGGVLRIAARNVDRIPSVRRHAESHGNFIAITVSDTGCGIEPSLLERIFEPFFTTKETNKGTGLGLSQVFGFAKQSGGEIDVQSRQGQGSAFTLYLPQAATPRTASSEQPQNCAVRNGAAQRTRVLVVEDNDRVGKFARDLLSELGHEVALAGDATLALRLLHETNAEFDVVLSDVVMPGVSGIELAREIRHRWPDLRVVLTSGYSHVLAEQGYKGFEFLQKPYSLEGLLSVVGQRNGDADEPA